MSNIEIQSFPVFPLECNCSIIRCKSTGDSAIIDPGGDAQKIIKKAEDMNCNLKMILLTHAHFDHCLALGEVTEYFRDTKKHSFSVALHARDMPLFRGLEQQSNYFGIPVPPGSVEVDLRLRDEEVLKIGEISLKVIYTPGHTPGSCSFFIESEKTVFSGDTLFAMGVGRTDLPGGNSAHLMESIKNRLLTLSDDTNVIPGHGNYTTIGEEKQNNPFLIYC